ncbi:Jerky protein-like 36 [Homarus americanus]|uniref:Jerky protein-like 36 n=1 Tax=Homarus americanus TaxID=6706 RepID=A0A8J5K2X9_HOMAM|nr:Jerky protein-like 36 [Homarus americanus]
MEEGQYTDDQVFNMDESGLFWKKLPSKTFVVKSASKCRSRKLQKERITVLFTTNASGTCKLKLSVIHTARKPHAYKNMDMTKLNVHWLTSHKAWMFTGGRQRQPVAVAVDLAREAAQSVAAAGFSKTTNEDIMEVTVDEMLEDDDISEEAGEVNTCITDFFARYPPQPAQVSDSDSDGDFEGFVREALTSVVDSDSDSPEGH